MNLTKLFGVLVVGGSLLVAPGACSDDRSDDKGPLTGVDAAESVDGNGSAADANMSLADAQSGDGGELSPCFCDSQSCCDNGTLQFGFECCWGTTC